MHLNIKATVGQKMKNEFDFNETTEYLLRNPSNIKKWLTLADKYMQTFAKDPSIFLLPKTHEFLKPLIEAYAFNIDGFVQYIVGIRDSFSKEDLAWEQVQNIQRRVNGRYVQQQRRERAQRAIATAEELYGETDYHSRLKWVADLEHAWAGRRLLFLDSTATNARAIGSIRIPERNYC